MNIRAPPGLEFKLDLIGLSLEERNALRELKNLDYLAGR